MKAELYFQKKKRLHDCFEVCTKYKFYLTKYKTDKL